MDFDYKEHFSSLRVFINSFPVSALTGIDITLKGANRNFHSIQKQPSNKVVPVSRSYEISLKREPDANDDFTLPTGEFTLSVMDGSSHTVYRGCAVAKTVSRYAPSNEKEILIVSNKKWEFNSYKYFGGGECIAET